MRNLVRIGVLVFLYTILLVNPVYCVTKTTSLLPVADTYVESKSPTKNYGSSKNLIVSNEKSTQDVKNVYLKYDLSSLPSNVKVKSAVLTITIWLNEKTIGLSAYYCSDTKWTENSLTWNNAPKYETTPIVNINVNKDATSAKFNVTSATQKSKQFTIVLTSAQIQQAGYVGTQFDSKEGKSGPKLDIIYEVTTATTPPPTTPTPTPSPTKTPTPTTPKPTTTPTTTPSPTATTPAKTGGTGGLESYLLYIVVFLMIAGGVGITYKQGLLRPVLGRFSQPAAACPECGKPLMYLQKYSRHYCQSCMKYMPKGWQPGMRIEGEAKPPPQGTPQETESLEEWYERLNRLSGYS